MNNSAVVDRIEKLERDSYASQQYSRRDTIEIVGMPENVTNESLEAKSIEIMKAIGANPSPQNIQACHRIGKNATIIKFVNRKTALECLRNKGKVRDIDKTTFGFVKKLDYL